MREGRGVMEVRVKTWNAPEPTREGVGMHGKWYGGGTREVVGVGCAIKTRAHSTQAKCYCLKVQLIQLIGPVGVRPGVHLDSYKLARCGLQFRPSAYMADGGYMLKNEKGAVLANCGVDLLAELYYQSCDCMKKIWCFYMFRSINMSTLTFNLAAYILAACATT